MANGEVALHQFSRDLLVGLIGDKRLEQQQSASVEYLISYLADLKVESVVVESHYVDRHFLDDYVHYYARSFRPPTAHCTRLHFWTLSLATIGKLFESAYQSVEKRGYSEKKLQEGYLGFVVKRPLAGAPIGRTVLKTYPADGRRHYEVVRPYRVNLAGLSLSVQGLAYQQQDRGAAVCASTALWSALQRVASVSGHRTPTPIAITRAANSPFPASHGLQLDQMASALSSLGYVADVFSPEENRILFKTMVVACLQSQLPVILGMTRRMKTGAGEKIVGHAITVTGYAVPDAIVEVPSPDERLEPVKMRGGTLDTVYAHDDNLGSHAHYELFDSDDLNEQGHKKLMLRRGKKSRDPVPWWSVDEWAVEFALVPKPDKLRLPIQSLFLSIVFLRPIVQLVYPGMDLHYEARFGSGVHYRSELFDAGLDMEDLRAFQFKIDLPRHVGVISVLLGDERLCDVVLDVTEIERNPTSPNVVAIASPGTPKNSVAWVQLTKVANYLKAPFIAAPIRP